jgi:hypothetical protein
MFEVRRCCNMSDRRPIRLLRLYRRRGGIHFGVAAREQNAKRAIGSIRSVARLVTLTYARWRRHNSRAIETPPPYADDQEITVPPGHYSSNLPLTHTRTRTVTQLLRYLHRFPLPSSVESIGYQPPTNGVLLYAINSGDSPRTASITNSIIIRSFNRFSEIVSAPHTSSRCY